MKTPTHDSSPDADSPVPKPPRWRKILRRVGISAIAVTSLTALFYAVENWRGSRAWAATLEELEASGAATSLGDRLLAPVPDDRNVILHPAFRCFTFIRPDGVRVRRSELHGDSLPISVKDDKAPHPADPADSNDAEMLARWEAVVGLQDSSAWIENGLYDWKPPAADDAGLTAMAESVLSLTAPYEPLLASIREALSRPECRWPTVPAADGRENPMASMGIITTTARPLLAVTRLIRARAWALAATGKPEEAWADLALQPPLTAVGFGINRNVMCLMLAGGIDRGSTDSIESLLELPLASAGRLREMERRLAEQESLVNLLKPALEGERAFAVAQTNWILGMPSKPAAALMSSWGMGFHFLPKGWFQQSAASVVRLETKVIGKLDPALPEAARIAEWSQIFNEAAEHKISPWHRLAARSAQVYSGLAEPILNAESRKVLVRTALLAAQQRVATGKTPLSLDELSPELRARVPHSPVMGDQPEISRETDGIWQVSVRSPHPDVPGDPSPSVLRIRGW